MRLRFKCMWIFSVALIILSVSGVPKSYAVHELFKSIDKNADGKINQEEFSADTKEYVFEKVDDNNNESISKTEWMSIEGVSEKEKHEELFQRIDKDKDNRITFFEFADYADKHSNIEEAFIGLDKDSNNSLLPDEITNRPLFKMITIKFK